MGANKPVSISIIDSKTIFRNILTHHLEEIHKYRVVLSTGDSNTLLHYLKSNRRLPDIIIMDINTPPLSVYELVPEIKQTWPDIQIVIIAAICTEFNLMTLIRQGISGFLTYETSCDEFHNCLKKLAAGEKHFPDILGQHFITAIKRGRHYPIGGITTRELQFLNYCGSDLVYKEIAAKMGVSTRTVEMYRDNLFAKLNIHTRTGLAIYAFRNGLVPL